ncbi:hypothetical protein Agabi119p4_3314 [Agaricus bisporus var. burnettii]|uniref:Uncharacterized protein n=1 Tax=Agaricus bisporus var. burnettii TaxID=192524 RepID=A0A8H7F6Z7_AGABI|nr:hypothetical protein Agabi119p4_3314 [Agaricus bisporus var. burnettii]
MTLAVPRIPPVVSRPLPASSHPPNPSLEHSSRPFLHTAPRLSSAREPTYQPPSPTPLSPRCPLELSRYL